MRKIHLLSALAPRGLSRARRDNVSWEEFSQSEEGHALRQAKCDEQKGLCGYCECSLADADGALPKGAAHIDHFSPRNRHPNPHPELTYEWGNMVLSCMCPETCGKYKDGKSQKIPTSELLNPHVDDPRHYIRFVCANGADSQSVPSEEQDIEAGAGLWAVPAPGLSEEELLKAQKTIDAFNLNQQDLLWRRTNEVWKYKPEIDVLSNDLQQQDGELLAVAIDEDLPALRSKLEDVPFCSAMQAYAKGKCLPFWD